MKHTFTFKTTKILLPLFAILLIAATACNKKTETQVTGTAYVEVTNASQGASPFDFYVSDVKKNSLPIPYGQTTAYIPVVAGVQSTAAFKVNLTGAALASFNLNPYPNAYYSIFYFGSNTASYVDDLTIVAGKARVRFINLNLGLTDDLDYGVSGTPTPIVSSLKQVYDSPYVSVAPGATISVYSTGTTTALLTIPTTLEAGHVYTIYLSGTTTADLQSNILVQK